MTDTILRNGDLVLFYPHIIDRSKQLIGTYHGPCALTANEHHHVKVDLNEPHRHIPLCDIRKLPPLKVGEPVWCPVTIGGKHSEGFFGRIDSYESEQDLHSACADATVDVLHHAHGTTWRCPHRALYIPGTQPPAQPVIPQIGSADPLKALREAYKPYTLGEFVKEYLPLEIELTLEQQRALTGILDGPIFKEVKLPLQKKPDIQESKVFQGWQKANWVDAILHTLNAGDDLDIRKMVETSPVKYTMQMVDELLELRAYKKQTEAAEEIDNKHIDRIIIQLDKSPIRDSYRDKPVSECAALELERFNSPNTNLYKYGSLTEVWERANRFSKALTMIRESGHNEHPTTQWMQKLAAWALVPEKFQNPGPLVLLPRTTAHSPARAAVEVLGEHHINLARLTDRLEAKVARLQKRLTAIYKAAEKNGKHKGLSLETWFSNFNVIHIAFDEVLEACKSQGYKTGSHIVDWIKQIKRVDFNNPLMVVKEALTHCSAWDIALITRTLNGGWPINQTTYNTLDAIAKGAPTGIPSQGVKPRRLCLRLANGILVSQWNLGESCDYPEIRISPTGTFEWRGGNVRPGNWTLSVEP